MGNSCCTTTQHSFPEPDSSLPWTLERLLVAFLLCFEAAVDSIPFAQPILSTTRQVPAGVLPWSPSHLEVWEFVRVHLAFATPGPHNLEGLPAWYRQVHAALRVMNMCDHFCFFLEAPLRAKLAELNLGTVRWMRFNPRPLAFYAEILPHQDRASSHLETLDEVPPPLHSVLEITTCQGEELIFDGTPQQFGWSDSAWTKEKKDIEMYHVEGQQGMWEYDDDLKQQLKALIMESDPLPWGNIFQKMEELSVELDWDALKDLADEDMWARVSDQARRKFVNAQS